MIKKTRPVLDVIFRVDKSGDFEGDVSAVFPSEAAVSGDWYTMMCFDPQSGHGACNLRWYRTTRPATPEEYAPLLERLRDIHETDDEEGVTLRVVQRITERHRRNRRKQIERDGQDD